MPMIANAAAQVVCPAPAAGRIIQRKSGVPAAALSLLPPMADAGGAWQVTDAIVEHKPPLPFARFIIAYARGCDLTVRFEVGGIAHNWHTADLAFRQGKWRIAGERIELERPSPTSLPLR